MKDVSTPEPFAALVEITNSLNRRFPEGKDPFKQVSRLAEEVGELAQAVNHRQGMGIKQEKYGDADDQAFVKEVQDVLCAAIDIALEYDLLDELQASIAARYKTHEADGFNHSTSQA